MTRAELRRLRVGDVVRCRGGIDLAELAGGTPRGEDSCLAAEFVVLGLPAKKVIVSGASAVLREDHVARHDNTREWRGWRPADRDIFSHREARRIAAEWNEIARRANQRLQTPTLLLSQVEREPRSLTEALRVAWSSARRRLGFKPRSLLIRRN